MNCPSCLAPLYCAITPQASAFNREYLIDSSVLVVALLNFALGMYIVCANFRLHFFFAKLSASLCRC